MSILYSCNSGYFISHEHLINSFYNSVETTNGTKSFTIYSDIFNIKSPYKKLNIKRSLKKKSENPVVSTYYKELKLIIDHVKNMYQKFKKEIDCFLHSTNLTENLENNERAIQLSNKIYEESGKINVLNMTGENKNGSKCIEINGNNFLFPSNCKFYCQDVSKIDDCIGDMTYDLIIIDPPWWNKYIRRKRNKTNEGYKMMYNYQLKNIPIEKLLNDDGLLVVWCTNSLQNLHSLKNQCFPKWGVKYTASWYWLKITKSGEPINRFSEPSGKQPFEQIIFGYRNQQKEIEDGKLVVSIPSALHSHKPPLIELLQQHIPENPKCLELFARYLLPNWTSLGFEAMRFQHECLYEQV